jgi:CheY-like chemotaxis protein
MRAFVQSSSQAQSSGPQLIFQVSDTGIGIAHEHIDKIFMPFVQLQSSLNRQFGGTGLGLSIVKKLLEAQGGFIHLDSELGKGSCFTVSLPFHLGVTPNSRISAFPEESLQIMKEAVTGQGTSGQLSDGIRILLAEDNRVNSLIYIRYLKAKGYTVLHASNGQEAVEMAMKDTIDVMVLDMSMPIVDGFEVMQKLRNSDNIQVSDIPIIALTALAMKGDRERCLAAGADEYLPKPVKLNQLDITIKQILSQGVRK